jgi:hypothetical protein
MYLRLLLITLFCFPAFVFGQAPQVPPRTAYKLEYVINELENGKKVESRNYTLYATPERSCSSRLGTRVPYKTTSADGKMPQTQYYNVGTNIDCRVTPVSDTLAEVSTSISISSPVMRTAQEGERASTVAGEPLLRDVSGQGATILAVGKPLTIFDLDEPNSHRTFQVQLTVTRVFPPESK